MTIIVVVGDRAGVGLEARRHRTVNCLRQLTLSMLVVVAACPPMASRTGARETVVGQAPYPRQVLGHRVVTVIRSSSLPGTPGLPDAFMPDVVFQDSQGRFWFGA